MALARWRASIVDAFGDIVPNASIEVRREAPGAPLVQLYSDRDGTVAIGNPFQADAEGFAAFHVLGGAYRITATSGSFQRIWRYVGIGTAQELDVDTLSGDIIFQNFSPDAVVDTIAERSAFDGEARGYSVVVRFNDASPPVLDPQLYFLLDPSTSPVVWSDPIPFPNVGSSGGLENVVTPIQFGASGNGDGQGGGTDDSSAFAGMLAFAAANPGTIMDGLNKWYRLDGQNFQISDGFHLRNIKLDCSNAPDDSIIFAGGGTEDSPRTISSGNIGVGDSSFTLTDATGVAVGDWGYLQSTLAWAIPPSGGFVSELVNISAIVGNTITITETTAYAYETADNPVFVVVRPVTDITFENVHAIGNGVARTDGGMENPQSLMRLNKCQTVRVENCQASEFGSRVFGFDTCWDVIVENASTEGLTDGEGLNYGVAFTSGCHYSTVKNSRFHEHRHGCTIGGADRVNRFITYEGCKASSAHDAEAFDSHRVADVVTVTNCDIHAGTNPNGDRSGVILQCNNPIVRGITGSGRFINLVFIQTLNDTTRAPATIKVSDVTLTAGRCSNAVVYVDHRGQNIDSCVITNISNGGRSLAGFRSEWGVKIEPRAGSFPFLNTIISNCAFARIESGGIHILNTDTTISNFLINSNVIEMFDTSAEAILMNAGTGTFSEGTIVGNRTLSGSYAIRGIGTTNMLVQANGNNGSTNGVVVDGV